MNPNDIHPYTGKEQREYLTVVLEKTGGPQDDDMFSSMGSGKECKSLPGFKVTAMSIGDEISQQEYEEEFGE